MKDFRFISIEELLKDLDSYTYNQLHIHHTWKPQHSDFDGKNHIQLQEGMYNYHVNSRGWSDIGQHITIMPDGIIVTGRDFGILPASISGWNNKAFAVEVLGNFDIGHDTLQGNQKNILLRITRYFLDRFGEDSIKFHNEGPGVTKSCPGTSINKEKFIYEVKGLGKIFVDVDDSSWAYPYIKVAKDLGLIMGLGDGTFKPKEALTREEAVVLLIRLYEKITGKTV